MFCSLHSMVDWFCLFGPSFFCTQVFSLALAKTWCLSSHQKPGALKWPTDISLTKGLTSGADRLPPFEPRQFQHVSKPPPGAPPLAPLRVTISSLWARRTAPHPTVAALRRGLQTEMDFHGSPAGLQTHRIQCSSSVLVAPMHPINTTIMLKCTLTTPHPRLLRIFLHLCLFPHFGTC